MPVIKSLAGTLALLTICQAKASTTETAGDIVQIAVPALAYATTWLVDDPEGRPQFYKSLATNFLATHGLKRTVNKPRPDKSNNQSFPSGHTSAAFQGASFIHFRYGFKYAVPAYLAAGFVGYSWVNANKHDYVHVFAGAALGILSSWYFTNSWKDVNLTPIVGENSVGLHISKPW